MTLIKKIFVLIILVSLSGCSSGYNFSGANREWEKAGNEHLKLKAPKEKILSSHVVKKYKKIQKLGFVETTLDPHTASYTDYILEEQPETPDSIVEYTYISDIIATATPYFAEGENFSRAEYIDNKTIAFYAKEHWARDIPNIVNILDATTTLEAFTDQTGPTVKEIVLSKIFNSAVATTTYSATGTTTYIPPDNGTVSLLIVGGGGGGGCQGGGGGAGRLISTTSSVTVQSYTIIVGDGGSGHTGSGGTGQNGATSSFSTIQAIGGGGGGDQNIRGANGSSGGGGGSAATATLGGTGSYGGNGGTASASANYGHGGGGGSGGNGANGTGTNGGNGGNGTANSITGSSVLYAGGGGGGIFGTGTAGTGQAGGGNGSVELVNGNDAAANTGSGGGGAGRGTSTIGGKGGSGVVILSFTAAGNTLIKNSSIINFE